MPVPTALERVGEVLAERYLLEELLARGGMGVLYLGRHLLTGRRVAVKVMRPEDEEVDAVDAERFLREARLASALEHPHVVQVFDMGVDQGAWFLVMEYLEGESLDACLRREVSLSPERALEWLLPVMGALATAHDHGIVHRDVKPENLFLARRGPRVVPTLLDFGIAKHAEAGTLTQRGMAVGTPMFMSPEQVRGEGELGPRTDVWSMGVVFYVCLTGRLPFEATNPASVLVKIISQPAPRLTETATWLPSGLAAAVDRALASRLEDRYADMREFAAGLVRGSAGAVRLPDDPDPVGLPAYAAWTGQGGAPAASGRADGYETLAASVPSDDQEVPSESGLRRSSKPPGHRRLRWLALIGFSALLGAAAAWAWLGGTAPAPAPSTVVGPEVPPAPSAENPPPAKAPAKLAADPEVGTPPPAEAKQAPEEAPVQAPPASLEAAGKRSRPKAPAARERSRRRRSSARRRPRVPAPAKRSGADAPAKEPEPAPAELEEDPFRIRRDYGR